jgi:hypothetical protein
MTVIDFHTHIGVERWNPWVLDYLNEVNPNILEAGRVMKSPGETAAFLRSEGLDYAIVLAEYSPLCTGVVSNEYVHKFCKGQESLIPFASLHPGTMKSLPKKLDVCVKEMGFRGLKLYPTYQQFYPSHQKMYPLYEKAQELGIPVMFHTGSSVYRNARLKYGDPLLLDDIAVDFPDLKIVMAHSGRGIWYDSAFMMARLHPNVYMEISGLPPKNLLKYFPELEKVQDKVIFGSDWPGTPGIGKALDGIRKLPISKTAIKKIIGGNARNVLGI